MRDDFRILSKFYNVLIRPKNEIGWIDHICLANDNLVLDVGGGTGRIAEVLVEKQCRVILFDQSISMLRNVISVKSKLRRICADIEQIAFESEQFDNVIMVDTLHHVGNQQKAIDSILYVLKPGGIFILEEPDIRKFSVKLIAILEKVLLMRSRFLYPEETIQLFSKHNVDITTIEEDFNIYFIVKKRA